MSVRKELQATAKLVTQEKKVRSRLEDLNKDILLKEERIAVLVEKVDAESEDIENLTKGGIKSFFYKVLGNKEQQMEKERQEYLQANLEYDEATSSLELLQYERNILEQKLVTLENVEAKYALLLKQREQEINESNPSIAKKIQLLDHNINANHRLIFELEEALDSGEAAYNVLTAIAGKLSQASDWGNWDMGGRGASQRASYMKHRYIDEAKQLAYQGQITLRSFEKELRDVYGNTNFKLSFSFERFSSFTDIFFDNLITDWIVQQKIHNTLHSIKSVADRTRRVIDGLHADISKTQNAIEDLQIERTAIIEA